MWALFIVNLSLSSYSPVAVIFPASIWPMYEHAYGFAAKDAWAECGGRTVHVEIEIKKKLLMLAMFVAHDDILI